LGDKACIRLTRRARKIIQCPTILGCGDARGQVQMRRFGQGECAGERRACSSASAPVPLSTSTHSATTSQHPDRRPGRTVRSAGIRLMSVRRAVGLPACEGGLIGGRDPRRHDVALAVRARGCESFGGLLPETEGRTKAKQNRRSRSLDRFRSGGYRSHLDQVAVLTMSEQSSGTHRVAYAHAREKQAARSPRLFAGGKRQRVCGDAEGARPQEGRKAPDRARSTLAHGPRRVATPPREGWSPDRDETLLGGSVSAASRARSRRDAPKPKHNQPFRWSPKRPLW
jgi:hypothetical protein